MVSLNRKQRRNKEPRFRGNNKGVSITVLGSSLYFREVQRVPLFDYDKKKRVFIITGYKRIEHYREKKYSN